jgi:hypothetical protein
MITVAPAEVLHGRREEREALERLLEAVRGGQSRLDLHAPQDARATPSLPAARTDIQRWMNEPLLTRGEQP